jgi:inosose dehydratase
LDPDRVLTEMRGAGLTATELGPEGFLPTDTEELKAVLREKDLACVGGFVPVVLFKEDHDPADDLAGPLESLVAAGAGVVVLAAATGADGYDSRPVLDDAQWARLVANLDRLAAIVAERGLLAVLHPHVGTIVETRADVDRVLQGSSIKLCLDTGHLLIGGTDPLAFVQENGDRIGHVHFKDVDARIAARTDLTLMQAVQHGLFKPLGSGDARIDEVVDALRRSGYERWLVLEQDLAITGSEPPVGSGPALDVAASIEFLSTLAPEEAVNR